MQDVTMQDDNITSPIPVVVKTQDINVKQADLRKGDLLDQIVERTGAKRGDAKSVLEATLAILGEQIEAGHNLNLPPLGKLQITQRKDLSDATVYRCKLRRLTKTD